MTDGVFAMQEVHIDALFTASRTVTSLFRPAIEAQASGKEIATLESDTRREFLTICVNLYALADAELRVRTNLGAWYLLDSVLYDFEEIALEAANMPFADRSESGIFTLVEWLLEFFDGLDDRKPDDEAAQDLFFFLKFRMSDNVSKVVKRIFSSEKSLLSYIHKAVEKHVWKEKRYIRKGNKVFDLEAAQADTATPRHGRDDLVALCSPYVEGSMRPGELVDLIFDRISALGKYRPEIEFRVLRSVVFELIKPRFTPPEKSVTSSDPYQDFLIVEMLDIANRIIDEVTGTYGWRENGSAQHKELYVKAARMRIEEVIRRGRRPSSGKIFREITGKEGEDYSLYQGGFQNFWKKIWDRFSDYYK